MIESLEEVCASDSILLVASTGGHLQQLRMLASRLGICDTASWVTFDHPQSRSLLDPYMSRVQFISYIAPRDLRGVVSAIPKFYNLMRNAKYSVVLSTGAAIAIPALATARALGSEAVYVESVSRTSGPSLTGRLMAAFRGVSTFTQHPEWGSKRWRPTASVLQQYAGQRGNLFTSIKSDQFKLFVTLGTIKPYRFDELIESVLRALPLNVRVVWQVGQSAGRELPGEVYETLSSEEFDYHVRSSDAVVSHAGVGSAISILGHGKCPVLVPRRVARREHVDDHQIQIARKLHQLGIAVAVEAPNLEWHHIRNAAEVKIIEKSAT